MSSLEVNTYRLSSAAAEVAAEATVVASAAPVPTVSVSLFDPTTAAISSVLAAASGARSVLAGELSTAATTTSVSTADYNQSDDGSAVLVDRSVRTI